MSDIDDFASDLEEEQQNVLINTKKKAPALPFESKDQEEEEEIESDGETQVIHSNASTAEDNSKILTDDLSPEELEKLKKERLRKLKAARTKNHKTGVVYFSSIPPYMKPAKMRQILTRFGEVDRLFLKREDEHKYKQRVRFGGNKKAKYEEGWAEFIRKRDAKLCAETLNGNILGGKKGSFYHDDILNVKYLSGFKWADLTEQIARENDIRQAKIELEMSQANKLNAEFIKNVEQSKMLHNIKESKKRKNSDAGFENKNDGIKRTFIQNRVSTSRADASESIKNNNNPSDKLNNVLSSIL